MVVSYTTPFGTLSSDSAPLTFGSDEPTNAYYFNGTIDEVRTSSAARSADWIATAYSNQNAPASFYTVGDEQATGGEEPVPELSTIILMGSGLAALAIYLWFRRFPQAREGHALPS